MRLAAKCNSTCPDNCENRWHYYDSHYQHKIDPLVNVTCISGKHLQYSTYYHKLIVIMYWTRIRLTNCLYSYTLEKVSKGSYNHDSDAMFNDQPIVNEENVVFRRGNNPIYIIVSFSLHF